VRVTFADEGCQLKIRDISDFDPTGLEFNNSNISVGGFKLDPTKFQDSEQLSKSFVLNGLHDFGPRFLDKTIGGIWSAPDLLSEMNETQSTYGYVNGNPLSFIDPSGMMSDSTGGSGRVPGAPESSGSVNREPIPMNLYQMPNFGSGNNNSSSFNQNVNSFSNNNTIPNQSKNQVGTLESFIPIWGSGKQAYNDFENGDYGWGAFNTVMAISDIFLIKSIATAGAKGAFKLGSHSWNSTRKWMLKNGYTKPGQPLHHWAISQKTAKKNGIEWLANQPWNMKAFANQSVHMAAGHGVGYQGMQAYSKLGQLYFGTPSWIKLFSTSSSTRVIQETNR
jgi:RHS repeat-associated protein